tara:strand:- start:255 stop:599 length:345 start_codon:yes stop_codon:yes gene_type:complete
MSNFVAFLDSDDLVTFVVQSPDDGQDWVKLYAERNNCKCLSVENGDSIRNKFPSTGDTYYEDIDAFIEPKFYPSWVLNKSKKQWEAPVAMPADGKLYRWDEETTSWKEVVDNAV